MSEQLKESNVYIYRHAFIMQMCLKDNEPEKVLSHGASGILEIENLIEKVKSGENTEHSAEMLNEVAEAFKCFLDRYRAKMKK